MNFIRSVLEHHRQGGDTDQIEEEYHKFAGNQALGTQHEDDLDVESTIHSKQPPNPYSRQASQARENSNAARSVRNGFGPNENAISAIAQSRATDLAPPAAAPSKQPVSLTADQRARIEAKRVEALERRHQRMHQQKAPFNPYAK